MRRGLHDAVKKSFGAAYDTHFHEHRFASSLGLRTTERLDGWFGALTKCLNAGIASPGTVALTLRFVEFPGQSAEPSSDASDYEEFSRVAERFMSTQPVDDPQRDNASSRDSGLSRQSSSASTWWWWTVPI